ncbi:MAG: hypothetical protein ACD_46C00571G0001 [uncultured bacterium]|nr:MAG: hypothetical protein ACD_46C00571G0001 [uncultured bacterium]
MGVFSNLTTATDMLLSEMDGPRISPALEQPIIFDFGYCLASSKSGSEWSINSGAAKTKINVLSESRFGKV